MDGPDAGVLDAAEKVEQRLGVLGEEVRPSIQAACLSCNVQRRRGPVCRQGVGDEGAQRGSGLCVGVDPGNVAGF